MLCCVQDTIVGSSNLEGQTHGSFEVKMHEVGRKNQASNLHGTWFLSAPYHTHSTQSQEEYPSEPNISANCVRIWWFAFGGYMCKLFCPRPLKVFAFEKRQPPLQVSWCPFWDYIHTTTIFKMKQCHCRSHRWQTSVWYFFLLVFQVSWSSICFELVNKHLPINHVGALHCKFYLFHLAQIEDSIARKEIKTQPTLWEPMQPEEEWRINLHCDFNNSLDLVILIAL